MAYVAATLTSPKNRVAHYGQISAPSTVRQDVSLAFDPDGLGTYVETGAHSGFCYTCVCWWFQNMQSWAEGYVPIPYAAVLTNTLQQGAAVCPAGMAGWSRMVTLQLQDQYGNPVQVSGINMADQITFGSPNDLGVGHRRPGRSRYGRVLACGLTQPSSARLFVRAAEGRATRFNPGRGMRYPSRMPMLWSMNAAASL